jgi:hypothetical protein
MTAFSHSLYACVYVSECACMHVCMYVHIHIYTHTHRHIYTCIHTHIIQRKSALYGTHKVCSKAATCMHARTLVASLNQNCLSSCAGAAVVCSSVLLLEASVALSEADSAARIDLSTGRAMPTSARKTVPSGALNIRTGPAACCPSAMGVAEASKASLP